MKSCYILRRNREPSLHITPFSNPKSSESWLEDEPIRWHASTGLTAKEHDDALYSLYEEIDKGVDLWILEARYVPRLLISALVFLFLYFFFSLAVRDSIPVIDEFLIGFAGALFTWKRMSKRDKKGELAAKRRLSLKQNASRSDFKVVEELSVLEDYLDKTSTLDTLELANRLSLVSKDALEELSFNLKEFAPLLIEHIKNYDKRLYSRYLTVMQTHKMGKQDELLSARLIKWAFRKEIDLPLLALMVVLSK